VRAVEASTYGARLREAMKTKPIYTVLQPHYNLVERAEYEADLGLGVAPYFALAAGFLSGKYRNAKDAEGKARGGLVEKYFNDRGFAALATLDEAAKEHSSTPARVALALLIAQPGITSPIASATNEAQFEDLAGAANLRLSEESIRKLNEASA